jgi:hypothetical protein
MSDQVENQVTTPQLNLSDLALALQTIQVVSQRGAIRADEMEAVGGLYTRLFKFLEAQGVVNAPAPTEDTAPDAPAESADTQGEANGSNV